jgi:hypothetical protein
MTIEEAIDTLAGSDPIVKLLQQVREGRMRSDHAGLRAITESWIETYRRVLNSVETEGLRRLDPGPRLGELERYGVLASDHAGSRSLRTLFAERLVSCSAPR